MQLAVRIYPQFIGGVAEVSTLKLRPKVLIMIATVAIRAATTCRTVARAGAPAPIAIT